MKNPDAWRKLEQQWEHAVEQAQENSSRQQPISNAMLDSTAGLAVKSGVRAGDWTQTYSCNGGCTHGMC